MELQNNASLRPYVTFGVDAHCDHLYHVEDPEELKLAAQYLERPLILGGGSNVLPMGNIHRNVLRIGTKGHQILKSDDRHVWVKFAAGETWHDVVIWALDQQYFGIENLSLIPGTIGAAPMQNIGAYGVELESVFDSLQAIELGSGTLHEFKHEDCRFGYRDSIFKNVVKDLYIIASVTLRFSLQADINISYGAIREVLNAWDIKHPEPKDVSRAVIDIRQSKLPDPSVIGNAGSFFKNPIVSVAQYERLLETYPLIPGFPESDDRIKVPAGWLIEQAGWKGRKLGDAGSYEKQALVLVNHGHATGEDIWQLAGAIMESVKGMFDISLTPEVNIWS